MFQSTNDSADFGGPGSVVDITGMTTITSELANDPENEKNIVGHYLVGKTLG